MSRWSSLMSLMRPGHEGVWPTVFEMHSRQRSSTALSRAHSSPLILSHDAARLLLCSTLTASRLRSRRSFSLPTRPSSCPTLLGTPLANSTDFTSLPSYPLVPTRIPNSPLLSLSLRSPFLRALLPSLPRSLRPHHPRLLYPLLLPLLSPLPKRAG